MNVMFSTVKISIFQTAESCLVNGGSIHKENSQECVEFHELLLFNQIIEVSKEFISIKAIHCSLANLQSMHLHFLQKVALQRRNSNSDFRKYHIWKICNNKMLSILFII